MKTLHQLCIALKWALTIILKSPLKYLNKLNCLYIYFWWCMLWSLIWHFHGYWTVYMNDHFYDIFATSDIYRPVTDCQNRVSKFEVASFESQQKNSLRAVYNILWTLCNKWYERMKVLFPSGWILFIFYIFRISNRNVVWC